MVIESGKPMSDAREKSLKNGVKSFSTFAATFNLLVGTGGFEPTESPQIINEIK